MTRWLPMTRWLALVALFVATPAWAQSGGKFEITRSTIDAGGSTERSPDNVVVRGTIGQPDVGTSASGGVSLKGGFWSTQGSTPFFSDGFETGDTSRWANTVSADLPVAAAAAAAIPAVAHAAEPKSQANHSPAAEGRLTGHALPERGEK